MFTYQDFTWIHSYVPLFSIWSIISNSSHQTTAQQGSHDFSIFYKNLWKATLQLQKSMSFFNSQPVFMDTPILYIVCTRWVNESRLFMNVTDRCQSKTCKVFILVNQAVKHLFYQISKIQRSWLVHCKSFAHSNHLLGNSQKCWLEDWITLKTHEFQGNTLVFCPAMLINKHFIINLWQFKEEWQLTEMKCHLCETLPYHCLVSNTTPTIHTTDPVSMHSRFKFNLWVCFRLFFC